MFVFPIIVAGGRLYTALVDALRAANQRADELLKLTDERAEQAKTAEALSDASAALATSLEPTRLYEIILQQMIRVLPCSNAEVFEYRDGWAISACGWGVPRLSIGARVVLLENALGKFPQGNDTARLIPDTRKAPGWRPMPPWVGEHEIRSLMVVPLILEGEICGCFGVGSITADLYTERHFHIVRAFGERINQALLNARMYQLERQRAKAAEHLAYLRGDFVTTVSHEFRTPLTAILGYAEMLQKQWERINDDQRIARVDGIVRAANRQKRLVDDVLLVAQLDTVERTLQGEPVPVVDVLAAAIGVVKGCFPDQQIIVQGPANLHVIADKRHAARILTDLIDNAAKYSDDGSPIEVTYSQEDHTIVVRVRDFGPGIPEDGRIVLFTRFGRIPGSRMRAGRVGTGLGLYLAREYALAMDGSLDVEDTGPAGSTFILRLPAAPLPACEGQEAYVAGSRAVIDTNNGALANLEALQTID
jgi:signal transduction histidine kinase